MEPMLFRRNAGLERLEWSGCKPASQSSCAGGTVPTLGVRHEHKRRLGEAGTIAAGS